MKEFPTFDGLAVSSKFAICGLPIRIDSYKTCSFGCKYCFANARKIMEFRKELQVCNIGLIEKKLHRIFDDGNVGDSFLDRLIADGYTWHFGGMSDPFQPINEELKVTNQIIDLTRRYGIHILFSTKSDTIHDANISPDLHTFQLSVSNARNRADIEPYVPKIEDRIKFFHRLKNEGFKVGIRIQPFIPNVSGLDIIKAFEDADHFTIEGLKIVPQNEEQKQFVVNVLGIPQDYFTQKGLLNLLPQYRLELYKPIIEYLEQNGKSYSISDNDLRYLSNNHCCCGDSLVSKATTFNTTSLLKNYGRGYTMKDALREVDCSGCSNCKCSHLFTSNRINGRDTIKDFYRVTFGQDDSPASPLFQYYPTPTLF